MNSKPNVTIGPWDAAVDQLRDWDPKWAEACVKMTTNPWESAVLPRKFIELVGVGLNAACTNLNPDGTRRHIRAALDAGATRDEILFVLKCASAMSIHSCSLGAPILLEEAKAAGKQPTPKPPAPTPACDKMKAIGQWNTAWDPFYQLDPVWTDEFMATGAGIYGSGVMSTKDTELLSIAFDASYTHMYAPGTRRHIHNAFQAGATMEEIMEVLKLCVVQGVQACNLGVPILAEELARKPCIRNPYARKHMSDKTDTETRPRKWEKVLVHEMFEDPFNFVFLSFFLVSFAWYRRLLLASYHIQYTGYWAPLVEAAVLAKVIIIGDALGMARGLRKWPLAVPTIYRTLMFSLLVVLFSVLEHAGGALLHGKKAAEGIAELTSTGWQGLLAWYVLIIAAFLPFFTVKEIERAFGQNTVRGMFFRKHQEQTNPAEATNRSQAPAIKTMTNNG